MKSQRGLEVAERAEGDWFGLRCGCAVERGGVVPVQCRVFPFVPAKLANILRSKSDFSHEIAKKASKNNKMHFLMSHRTRHSHKCFGRFGRVHKCSHPTTLGHVHAPLPLASPARNLSKGVTTDFSQLNNTTQLNSNQRQTKPV